MIWLSSQPINEIQLHFRWESPTQNPFQISSGPSALWNGHCSLSCFNQSRARSRLPSEDLAGTASDTFGPWFSPHFWTGNFWSTSPTMCLRKRVLLKLWPFGFLYQTNSPDIAFLLVMQELIYVYLLWFYMMPDHLLKRMCTKLLHPHPQLFFAMLQGLFLYCTVQLLLVPLQVYRKCLLSLSAPRLSRPADTLFSQMSHGLSCHSIPSFPLWLSANICTGMYTCQSVKS